MSCKLCKILFSSDVLEVYIKYTFCLWKSLFVLSILSVAVSKQLLSSSFTSWNFQHKCPICSALSFGRCATGLCCNARQARLTKILTKLVLLETQLTNLSLSVKHGYAPESSSSWSQSELGTEEYVITQARYKFGGLHPTTYSWFRENPLDSKRSFSWIVKRRPDSCS